MHSSCPQPLQSRSWMTSGARTNSSNTRSRHRAPKFDLNRSFACHRPWVTSRCSEQRSTRRDSYGREPSLMRTCSVGGPCWKSWARQSREGTAIIEPRAREARRLPRSIPATGP
jgi:hypothetical protein